MFPLCVACWFVFSINDLIAFAVLLTVPKVSFFRRNIIAVNCYFCATVTFAHFVVLVSPTKTTKQMEESLLLKAGRGSIYEKAQHVIYQLLKNFHSFEFYLFLSSARCVKLEFSKPRKERRCKLLCHCHRSDWGKKGPNWPL